ncbi:flagellar hook-length control protein FliK [Pseudomonas sp. RL_15y_Pfl2_60]|uniref:flagellar hook-length control protein FliK n=1 Tax=Pseudomonas sp. RL_15y_Pfl2_60 TaxID=3088709 RepID=UPI0030DB29F6
MSGAADLLLKPAVDLKPKVAAAKPQAKPTEPRGREASSFAEVYANERQAKPAERSNSPAKAANEHKAKAADDAGVDTNGEAQPQTVADSGNSLPTDPAMTQGEGEEGQADTPPSTEETDELLGLQLNADQLAQMTAVSANFKSSGPASMTDASFDADLDAMNQLPAVRMALDIGKAQAAANAEQKSPGAVSTQAALNPEQSFASAMAAMGSKLQSSEKAVAGEFNLSDLTAEALDSLKESSADTRPENFVSKLNALSQAVTQQTSLTPKIPVVGTPIAMQQGGWTEAVVDRVMYLSSQNLKSAEIQLDPAELGRLEVRIHMNHDQTQVSFASANAAVRDSLEGQMHRLREMFTQQGINLQDVSVTDPNQGRGWQGQGQNQQQAGSDGQRGASGSGFTGGHDEELSIASIDQRATAYGAPRSMVDYYA